jgi:hypothetical protein
MLAHQSRSAQGWAHLIDLVDKQSKAVGNFEKATNFRRQLPQQPSSILREAAQ